jgi:hypothetical protein
MEILYPYKSLFLCFVATVLAACLGHTLRSYDSNELKKLPSAATVRCPDVISFCLHCTVNVYSDPARSRLTNDSEFVRAVVLLKFRTIRA